MRRPLFEEGGHTFGPIFGGLEQQRQIRLEAERLFEGAGSLLHYNPRTGFTLNLYGKRKVVQLEPLHGIPLKNLRLEGTGVDSQALAALRGASGAPPAAAAKTIVEHTNINPNKAAHIGHLRNAILGDTFVRMLRAGGEQVEVQNYIDNTGVQVADVVVGFHFIEKKTLAEVAALAAKPKFDYYCWDLYAATSSRYADDPDAKKWRAEVLHAIEDGHGEIAEMGHLVADHIVQCHLATMARLGIGYDVLPRESEILHLKFWASAFELLKERKAIYLETEGKNAGCWVMPLRDSEEFAGLEDPDKVIVRSDGTVTYVGKDIAYQMWKFGLLGRDFSYRYWMSEGVWQTTADEGAAEHPRFGGGGQVINVIDARQSYLQKIVRAGLEALGHPEAAAKSVHFAYEMVALSTAAARTLGYIATTDESASGDASGETPAPAGAAPKKPLEMSGRKGIGVKADDLLDQLKSKSREEIAKRNRELSHAELDSLSTDIATAALRFLMTKTTTTRVIAFDFDEALNFEGESGPYLQYSAVRVRNIQRRLKAAGRAAAVAPADLAALPAEPWADDLWDLVLAVGQSAEVVEKAASSLELSLIARHALELAQRFNGLYHKHPILQEEDAGLRTARLATAQIFLRGLEGLAGVLGVPLPERM